MSKRKSFTRKEIEDLCRYLEGRSVLDYLDLSQAPSWESVKRWLEKQPTEYWAGKTLH